MRLRLERLLALIKKEFLALLKDPRSRGVIIFPPLLQTLMFGYAATFDIKEVPYVVYNEDHSEASRELLAGFRGSPYFRLVEVADRPGRIAELLDTEKAVLAVRIGPNFARNQERDEGVVQLIADGRNSNTAALALNYGSAIVQQYNEDRLDERGLKAPAVIISRSWYNENLRSRWFFVPGIVAMVTQVVTLLVTALSVAREREQGTFDQLLVTPYTPVDLIVGKAVPGFLIGLVEATVILLAAIFWFEVPFRGNLLVLYLGLILFLLSAVGVGLMISSLSATMQQGLLGTFIFLTPAMVLSGFATPVENMTPFVQSLTVVNPIKYILVIIREVFLKGSSTQLLVHQLWPLAVIGTCCLILAGWLFRRRIY